MFDDGLGCKKNVLDNILNKKRNPFAIKIYYKNIFLVQKLTLSKGVYPCFGQKMQLCSLFVLGQNKTRNNVLDRTVTFFFAKKFQSHKRKEIMINNVLDRKENFFGEN